MKQNNWRSIWSTIKQYVDMDTGEYITKEIAKKDYKIIKTKRYAERSKYGTGGIQHLTHECKRNQQGQLPFNNT